MRGVSRWASRVTPLVAVFVVLAAASAWAGETQTPPTDPPEARVQPPVGVTSQARVNPPGGVPTPDQMPLMDMILIWLQSRLSVPHG
jgi:hypothetical protein